MNILYDHQMFSLQKYGGITKYFTELMSNIQGEHQFQLSVLFSDNEHLREKQSQFHKKNILPKAEFKGKYLLKNLQYRVNEWYSEKQIKKNKFDLLHPTFYDNYFFEDLRKPYVITVHDLIAFKFKDSMREFVSIQPHMEKAILNANRIITVSKNTKKDVMELFNIASEKIDVVYHGFNKPLVQNDNNKYGAYILFVGNRDSYKNFKTFIKAASILLTKERTLKLICVGKAFSKEEIIQLKQLKINEQVTALSVSERDLNNLYRHAKAFVYPSLYEGFGMPILEAFANDCPVCVSNASCFPEIAGDAALYFDPLNEDSILTAIENVIYKNDIKTEIINKGKKRLEDFSWTKTALETIDTYKKTI